MFVVDTNILLYGADTDAPEHEICRVEVERWRRNATPWYVTPVIVYEFLRASTHRQVFRRPWTAEEALGFIESLFASSTRLLTPGDEHVSILRSVLEDVRDIAGNFFYDAQTAALMREHGVRTIVTHDRGFRRFPFLEVIDPLA